MGPKKVSRQEPLFCSGFAGACPGGSHRARCKPAGPGWELHGKTSWGVLDCTRELSEQAGCNRRLSFLNISRPAAGGSIWRASDWADQSQGSGMLATLRLGHANALLGRDCLLSRGVTRRWLEDCQASAARPQSSEWHIGVHADDAPGVSSYTDRFRARLQMACLTVQRRGHPGA